MKPKTESEMFTDINMVIIYVVFFNSFCFNYGGKSKVFFEVEH